MEIKKNVSFFFLMTAVFLLLSPGVKAYEVGDTVTCVKVKEIYNPDGPAREEAMDCLENPDENQHQFTMLEFFTVECGYCTQNLPIFARLAKEIAGTTSTRLVSLNRSRSQLDGYIERNRAHMVVPLLLDERREAGRTYDIRYVPSIFVINKDKKIVFKKIGVLNEQDLQSIRQLVGQENSIE